MPPRRTDRPLQTRRERPDSVNDLGYLLAACFALGVLHGVIPDEHTWPITFAYSIGTTTGRGGIRSAGFFSLAFTLQRAVMSQLVYFAIAVVLVTEEALNGPIYVVVGIAMLAAGYLILTDRLPHVHPLMRFSRQDLARHAGRPPADPAAPGEVPVHWALIHGFISGFGVDTGAFTVFVYLTAIPALAEAGLWQIGWLPGALFGLGTFLVLMAVGFFFGQTLQVAKRFGAARVAAFGRLVGARMLLFGGLAFIVFGPIYLLGLAALLPFDFESIFVIVILVGVAVPIMLYTWREVARLPREAAPATGTDGSAHPREPA